MKAGTLENEIENVSKSYTYNDRKITGVSSGFSRLDDITGGFQNSDLIVVASRPGMGKTSFALNIAKHVSELENLRVLFFTLEMNRDTAIERLQSLENGLNVHAFGEEEPCYLPKTRYRKFSVDLLFFDYIFDANEIMDECQRRKIENNVDLIIIDYFQLLNFWGDTDIRQRKKYLPKYLKQLARAIDCPVIVFSQLNRDLESRECKRPLISDIQESGHFIEYADFILFLYRDDYYDLDSEEKDICEVIVANNKNCTTGTARLKWIEEHGLFCDE